MTKFTEVRVGIYDPKTGETEEVVSTDGLFDRAQTRSTPLLAKLADLSDAEWDELAHRTRKHFERALAAKGYEVVPSAVLDACDALAAEWETAADLTMTRALDGDPSVAIATATALRSCARALRRAVAT